MTFRRLQTLCLVLGCSAASGLSADTLTLRDGRVVQGTFLGGTAREVRMDTGSSVDTFPVEGVSGSTVRSNPFPISVDETVNRAPMPNQGSNYPPPQSNGGSSSGGFEIPGGTQITVRLIDSVDSENTRTGDTFRASLDEPVVVNGETVIPRGAAVVARLVEDQKSGKIRRPHDSEVSPDIYQCEWPFG